MPSFTVSEFVDWTNSVTLIPLTHPPRPKLTHLTPPAHLPTQAPSPPSSFPSLPPSLRLNADNKVTNRIRGIVTLVIKHPYAPFPQTMYTLYIVIYTCISL